ncbi:MAG: 16S rRNA (cytidine(1402)-2'-O)-methyltransferase [Candidatus Kerfeldbacteria bacterium RIFCSPHIGHO2_02_FULL_42_14]|uniref:Ribosomal RNA small subunit methyltransferase I n=1 Tax=Candidatus Kerfeldbacteria bacterium RIFCSPHIGHO2_02_FULL_42_14 TaxID=1798540 RepID=A0A1G2ANG3_9BACT|nr:MAG: 16S rRNA (cytidine(1402)-2'-O)-methyltransferase [Candidatus Kerfeldbacteria bacterium RIFCSPHIGHO2_02_FULL_42_14]OGY81796.1 MAG: 16S rRNA (cytidine(1402)-2'-O)-methyltransferase [Candidatus Kerfeldbacteria bacterium RIFCSPHIGHO2_12_FULL_42_13]OGY84485.1 MAG: 16S rRNA (cytidine(1402)-2'-O)-methyltransferase [Candidatus Kerfeldbacteria bacterium RIFCSPLOWO2_02_FULL_42_19]OGY87975.1 MAG: 16S rRNA (cytidine(1402)-2'-O)-methyltransferase [Candidatus Kerfeldbacteria bacterium RIFCSPLOWO2_12_F
MSLYIVPTPIGNLADITLRALEILKSADLIVCEDTRHTSILLKHYNIQKPTESYHQHSSAAKEKLLLEKLKAGHHLALVSDAGTPGVSDPGQKLVQKAIEVGIEVIPLPGPSALITAVSGAGIPLSRFVFLGFIPHKKGRNKLFEYIAASELPCVVYESPHRIQKTLQQFVGILTKDRKMIVAKDISKRYERFIRGTADSILKEINAMEKVVGEFVIIIDRKSK